MSLLFSEVHDSGKVTMGTAEQEETGWTDERPTHKIGWKTGADIGGGGRERKMESERRGEQEMPVCWWDAWKPEGNLNRLWLPLSHDRLLIPYPLSLLLALPHTNIRRHIHACTHKSAMHAGIQSYNKKTMKWETIRDHNCGNSCQKSLKCADAYINAKAQYFWGSINYIAAKTFKSPADIPAGWCLSKQQFTHTHTHIHNCSGAEIL